MTPRVPDSVASSWPCRVKRLLSTVAWDCPPGYPFHKVWVTLTPTTLAASDPGAGGTYGTEFTLTLVSGPERATPADGPGAPERGLDTALLVIRSWSPNEEVTPYPAEPARESEFRETFRACCALVTSRLRWRILMSSPLEMAASMLCSRVTTRTASWADTASSGQRNAVTIAAERRNARFIGRNSMLFRNSSARDQPQSGDKILL